MFRMILINVSKFTLFILKIMSIFLDPVTRSKMKSYSSSKP